MLRSFENHRYFLLEVVKDSLIISNTVSNQVQTKEPVDIKNNTHGIIPKYHAHTLTYDVILCYRMLEGFAVCLAKKVHH